ncbi:MAG: Asp23/Gls24 family envelope stress response protein [Oscillospiraceae bacterium]|nr:Asp23/Gls24 family envelope stress response protein [Oscillospiraceae bacterium]
MKIQMEKGNLVISNDVFTQLAGVIATNCFGVKGMAVRSKTDGLVHLLRRESMAKGVKVTPNEDGSVTIDLHIIVDSGVNIAAISSAITNEVTYTVQQYTGVPVRSVEIFIDSISFS